MTAKMKNKKQRADKNSGGIHSPFFDCRSMSTESYFKYVGKSCK